MKRFLLRALKKIVHFFWSWGFLKFILWCVTLYIFLYVEEDWRGAHAWAATKAKWEAKGETFDLGAFIPPTVPDDQNLAAIPLFKLEAPSKTVTYLVPVALNQAMRMELPNVKSHLMGAWPSGEFSDMAKIRAVIATDYATVFKRPPTARDALAQFDALYPFLTDLRAAAATHPLCRLNLDYTSSPPAARALGPLTALIPLSRILTLHAILELDHHQPDVALEDIKINYQLLSGAERQPTLVGGLVALGMATINQNAVRYGLALHAWNDSQLAEIDRILKPLNFLADNQFAMRSEAAEAVANIDFYKQASHMDLYELLGMSDQTDSTFYQLTSTFFGRIVFVMICPEGWWDNNKSQLVEHILRELATVDPESRRAFPKESNELQNQVDRAKTRWGALAPWNIWATIAVGPVTSTTGPFARAQVLVDEARIACALERYRLAHGVYLDSLGALAPAYLDELPHDIINGQPYHYQLRPDGTFLLYSVGWNEKDDGGQIVYKKKFPSQVDYLQGDWVWPTAQAASTSSSQK